MTHPKIYKAPKYSYWDIAKLSIDSSANIKTRDNKIQHKYLCSK